MGAGLINAADLFKNPEFAAEMRKQFDMMKADTFTSSGNLV